MYYMFKYIIIFSLLNWSRYFINLHVNLILHELAPGFQEAVHALNAGDYVTWKIGSGVEEQMAPSINIFSVSWSFKDTKDNSFRNQPGIPWLMKSGKICEKWVRRALSWNCVDGRYSSLGTRCVREEGYKLIQTTASKCFLVNECPKKPTVISSDLRLNASYFSVEGKFDIHWPSVLLIEMRIT